MADVTGDHERSSLPLSIVVVSYEMAREVPRTLRSLASDYQRDVEASDYEVILVDNGSRCAPDPSIADRFAGNLEVVHLEPPAPPSPARAANVGLRRARGELIGLLVDGARIASPGLLATARVAARLADRPVVASLAWHLGPDVHMNAAETGYDQVAEDRLLEAAQWETDGYRLFEISTLAASSNHGWFGPLGESNGLFLPRAMWRELGGLDEAFRLAGGGRVNHDLYRRACELPGAQLVVLLGEGTFHQTHGGAWTSGGMRQADADVEYEALRGRRFQRPANDPVFVGRVPQPALRHLEHSVRWAVEHSSTG